MIEYLREFESDMWKQIQSELTEREWTREKVRPRINLCKSKNVKRLKRVSFVAIFKCIQNSSNACMHRHKRTPELYQIVN